MSDIKFSIKGESTSKTKYKGQTRQFSIEVDEPEDLGGTDAAPNPVEYLLAGYAGCLNVVIQLVAEESAINIKQLNIDIEGDINPKRFLGVSNEERAGYKELVVNINIDADATDAAVKELIEEVKRRCPVNDNLINPTPVDYRVKTDNTLILN